MRALAPTIATALPLLLAAAGPAAAQAPAQGPVYVVTYVELQAAAAKNGAALLRQYRDGARKEAGNLEADLAQEVGRPYRFVVIEGWRDQAAFDAHDKGDAAQRTRSALVPMQGSPPDQRVNLGLDLAPAAGKGAFVVATHVDVIPPRQAATETALKAEAAATRKDQGNLRCDVFQQLAPRTNHFNMLAVWSSQSDFDRHETQAHRVDFRTTLAPMLGALFDERLYRMM